MVILNSKEELEEEQDRSANLVGDDGKGKSQKVALS